MNYRLRATFLLAALLPLTASAHPITISCPVDGNPMGFDHQVGLRENAVCWYSHFGTNPNSGSTVKHEAYVPCGD